MVESFVVVVVVVVVESVCVCVCVCVCVFFVFSLVASKTHTTHKVFFDEKDEKNFEEEEKKSEKNTQTETDRQTRLTLLLRQKMHFAHPQNPPTLTSLSFSLFLTRTKILSPHRGFFFFIF